MTSAIAARQPELLTGGQINPGNPLLTIHSDPVYGTFIQTISANGLTAYFAPCFMFRASIWSVAGGSPTVVQTPDDVEIETQFEATTGVWVFTASFPDYPGISVQARLTPIPEGFRVTQTPFNTSATRGLEWWEFPRLGCVPDNGVDTDAFIAHGFTSGLTMRRPNTLNFDTGYTFIPGAFNTLLPAPSAMQYTSYFNKTTKLHVYVQTDDDVGYSKEWGTIGQGIASVQFWRHHPKNPRKAGNNGAGVPLTYNQDIIVFRGRCSDGRCGAYDAAIRYRAYGTGVMRSWMTRGPWADALNVPDRVKNSRFYYVSGHSLFGTPWIEDARRVKTFLGASNMMLLAYNWGKNQGALLGPPTFRPPEFTPMPNAADITIALQAAAANNIHVSYYTIPHPWDTTLTLAGAFFRYTHFLGSIDYGALAQYMIKDVLGNVATANQLAYWNLNSDANLATIKAIIADIHGYNGTLIGGGSDNIGYYTQLFGAAPRGWYYDLWGGGGVLFNYDPAVDPNGNIGTWEINKNALTVYLRDRMRAVDPAFYFSTENCEEAMIPSVDVMHIGDLFSAETGVFDGAFSVVYSRYQCLIDLSITLNQNAVDPALGIPSSQYAFYLGWVVWMWHETGGHVCINNGQNIPLISVDPPTIANCPEYILLVGAKRLIERLDSNADMKNYMQRGIRMRPLPASWEGTYLEAGLKLKDWIAGQMNSAVNPQHMICSSVWQNVETGSIGIVLTNHETMNLVYHIHVEAAAYDLNPGSVYALYRNVAGVRTEVKRFTDILDYDHTLGFDAVSLTCDLLEIALAGEITTPPVIFIDEPDPGETVIAGGTLLIEWHI